MNNSKLMSIMTKTGNKTYNKTNLMTMIIITNMKTMIMSKVVEVISNQVKTMKTIIMIMITIE